MNRRESWRPVLDAELKRWSAKSYDELIADMVEALAFGVEGKVKADIELQPLSAINDIFKRLKQGDVPARVVIDHAA